MRGAGRERKLAHPIPATTCKVVVGKRTLLHGVAPGHGCCALSQAHDLAHTDRLMSLFRAVGSWMRRSSSMSLCL